MSEFLIWVVLASVWCFGVNNAFSDGEIFGSIGDWLHEKLPTWLYKPTIGCPKCQASIHGAFWYWYSRPFELTIQYFLIGLLFIVAVSGINTVIINFLKKDEKED